VDGVLDECDSELINLNVTHDLLSYGVDLAILGLDDLWVGVSALLLRWKERTQLNNIAGIVLSIIDEGVCKEEVCEESKMAESLLQC